MANYTTKLAEDLTKAVANLAILASPTGCNHAYQAGYLTSTLIGMASVDNSYDSHEAFLVRELERINKQIAVMEKL